MIETYFFQDLAVLMTAAGVVSVVFARLGWPKVLGYILAGVVMSPHTWGGSFLLDLSSTNTIGQLGVVFLMFGMGLSFSAKDMQKIRGVALPAAVLDAAAVLLAPQPASTPAHRASAVETATVFFQLSLRMRFVLSSCKNNGLLIERHKDAQNKKSLSAARMAQQKDPCRVRAFRYNQFLVVWSVCSRTNSRQVS